MGGFSKAAKSLKLTQPAVSLQIQALERYFDAQLIVRGGRTIALTPAGQVVYELAGEVLAVVAQGEKVISQMTGEVAGPVVIGASTIPGEYVLPYLINAFTSAYPKVQVTLHVSDSSQVLTDLEGKRMDIGVVGLPVTDDDLIVKELGTDPITLVLPRSHNLAAKSGLAIEDLKGMRFVSREEGSGSKAAVHRALRAQSFDPESLHTVMEVGSASAQINAVEAGIGAAFCSRYAAAHALQSGTIVERPVEGLSVERTLYVVAPRGRFRTRAADMLLTYLSAERLQNWLTETSVNE
jgi:DNA-binding transcriptional LysR family regulator